MKIDLLVVGRPKLGYAAEGIEHYLKLLAPLAPVRLRPVKPAPLTRSASPDLVRRAEADRLLARLTQESLCVVLDGSGSEVSSEELAGLMADWEKSGRNRLSFIIGGPIGLDREIIRRADLVWSLSRLTLPHELCLLVALEQLYRALAQRAGLPYGR